MWDIAKTFGSNIKKNFKKASSWKAIAKKIFIQLGAAAIITGLVILNPIAGAIAAAAWAAFNIIKGLADLVGVVLSCLREDYKTDKFSAEKNCG